MDAPEEVDDDRPWRARAQRAQGIAPTAVVVPFQIFMGDPAFERVEAAIRDGGSLAS